MWLLGGIKTEGGVLTTMLAVTLKERYDKY